MKRAFLVLGAPSTGTRMVTAMLIEAGCLGSSGHEQWLDDEANWQRDLTPIVIRRSVPHGTGFPDVAGMITRLREQGYTVHAIVTTRHFYPMQRSQLQRGHFKSEEEAWSNLWRCYPYIFNALSLTGTEWTLTTYEAMVYDHPAAMLTLMRHLKLNSANLEYKIEPGNAKWFRGKDK